MNDILLTAVFIVGVYVVLPVLILAVLSRLSSPGRNTMDPYEKQYLEQLDNPDFVGLENHFGSSLPEALSDLYKNRDAIRKTDFEIVPSADAPGSERWYVGFFQPAHLESVREIPGGHGEVFAFANDGAGNEYVLDPAFPDPPVFFHDHETGEMLPVCGKVSVFLAWGSF